MALTTTYHTSSSDSSLISLTDEEVIYTKMNAVTLNLKETERERKREIVREGGWERGRKREGVEEKKIVRVVHVAIGGERARQRERERDNLLT